MQPPAHVSSAEFNEWYDAHMNEILEVPTFVAAQRFRIDDAVCSIDGDIPFSYAAVYEVEGDFAGALAEQEKASVKTYEQYVERKKHNPSGPPVPAWLPEVRFVWWNGIAVSPRFEQKG
jgi:hypothetical protein